MPECNDIIIEVYTNPKLLAILKSIKPIELQSDLLQELAIALLDYDCTKLRQIHSEGKLINFSISILWKMGTLQNGYFYKTYKRNDIGKAMEYIQSTLGQEIPDHYSQIAKDILNNKLSKSAGEAHEAMIFMKYVELESCQKVADYFGVPRLHIFQVVKSVKEELKKSIKK